MLSSRLSQDRCGCWACRRGSWCLRAPSSLNGLARPPTSQLRKFRVCGMSDLLRTGRDSGAAPPRGLLTCRFNFCAPHADISVLDLLQWDQEWPLQTLRRYHTPGSASCYKRTKSGREVELFKRQAAPSYSHGPFGFELRTLSFWTPSPAVSEAIGWLLSFSPDIGYFGAQSVVEVQ